jgi:hypothetical protein
VIHHRHNVSTETFRVTAKERSRASEDGYMVIVRPQAQGTYGMFVVDEDGRAQSYWLEVDDREELSQAATIMARDMDKFRGIGGDMSSSGRMRSAKKEDSDEPACQCSHAAVQHYAKGEGTKNPCRHLGENNQRCRCGNYEPAKAEDIQTRMRALLGEAKRTFSLGQTVIAQMEKNLASNLKDPAGADEEKYARQRKVPSSRHIKGTTERPPLQADGSQKAKKP